MVGTFTLKINLGNDAMKDPQDIAAALARTAERVILYPSGPVLDLNGNVIGDFRVQETPDED